jgi:lipopolysaccharide heptosyltransferase II
LGESDLSYPSWRQVAQLIRLLRPAHYDTVFIPSGSALLSLAAWQSGIHQRIGLDIEGRGFAHTTPVRPPHKLKNMGAKALLLAQAAGVDRSITSAASMEFRPSSGDRTAVTRLLVEDVDWLGDRPLVIMHPGGGSNPSRSNLLVRWPSERYVILGNYLAQKHRARVIIVGSAEEKTIAGDISGMMAGRVENYCGRLGLGELGALCEVADLYVGNDTGTSHVAAATGCQTLVIYGPTNPAYSEPYSVTGNVHALCLDRREKPAERPFSWAAGVTAEEAMTAADRILNQPADRRRTLAILSRRPSEKH